MTLRGTQVLTRWLAEPWLAAVGFTAGRFEGSAGGSALAAYKLASTVGGAFLLVFRGNHLSNTTCLLQVFLKSGESCSKLRHGDP